MTRLSPLLLLFLALGCSSAHTPVDDRSPDYGAAGTTDVRTAYDPVAPSARPSALPPLLPPVASALDECLEAGGALVEVDAVDNNDVSDHGALVALAVSADGRLAAAGEDGTIKFWSVDDGFLSSVAASALIYGAELEGSEVADLAFDGAPVVAGDMRGVVTRWAMDGSFEVVGGTTPDVPILAVAVLPGGDRVAHADALGEVMVRAPLGGSVVGPLDSAVASVTDLAFAPDGALVIGGGDAGGRAVVERRAPDSAGIEATWSAPTLPEIQEVSIDADGRVLAAGEGFVARLGADLGLDALVNLDGHAAVSVAGTPRGRVALSAGAEGRVIATSFDGHAPGRLAELDVPGAMSVRLAGDGALAFVGTESGMIRVLACE